MRVLLVSNEQTRTKRIGMGSGQRVVYVEVSFSIRKLLPKRSFASLIDIWLFLLVPTGIYVFFLNQHKTFLGLHGAVSMQPISCFYLLTKYDAN